MLRVFILLTSSEMRFCIIFHLMLPVCFFFFFWLFGRKWICWWLSQAAYKKNNSFCQYTNSIGDIYLNSSSKSPWVHSKQSTGELLLKVWIIKKKNNTLQSIILKAIFHTFKRKIQKICKSFLPSMLIWPPLLGLENWSSFTVWHIHWDLQYLLPSDPHSGFFSVLFLPCNCSVLNSWPTFSHQSYPQQRWTEPWLWTQKWWACQIPHLRSG